MGRLWMGRWSSVIQFFQQPRERRRSILARTLAGIVFLRRLRRERAWRGTSVPAKIVIEPHSLIETDQRDLQVERDIDEGERQSGSRRPNLTLRSADGRFVNRALRFAGMRARGCAGAGGDSMSSSGSSVAGSSVSSRSAAR